MEEIGLQFRTMFAELVQQSLDERFLEDFSTDGSFYKITARQREFWYYSSGMKDGKRLRRYVGPADDLKITERVLKFKELKTNAKERRRMIRALGSVGLPSPDRFTGDIVEALAKAGFFRLRGVLIGTVAFQTYAGILGVRLPNATMQTGDSDFAQFHSISTAVEDSVEPMLEILRSVDPTFREIPHQSDSRKTTRYQNSKRYLVKFLTPNRGSDDFQSKASAMPALGGASAIPLRFFDYLIHEPQNSVLLHKYGIGVSVPAPERYAVHKLIVAARRDKSSVIKRDKDIWQAGLLIETMSELRMQDQLSDAFAEAKGRGLAWRDAIKDGIRMLRPSAVEAVEKILS